VDLQRVNRRVVESLIKCGAFDSFGGHRAQYMAQLDRVLEESQRLQKIRARGQMSMFGGNGAPGQDAGLGPALSAVPEWGDQQRLEHEKETLGFYVTGHPLGRILAQVSSWTNADTETIAQLPDKDEVRIVGMKRASREVTTKKGDRMGFLTVEDLKGSVEVVCFPESFRKALPLIQEDRPLCVRGTVEHGEEQSKIIASDVLSLEEVRTLESPPLELILWGTRLKEGDLQGLRDVLRRYPGGRAVRLHLVLEEGQVAVLEPPAGFRIDPSDGLAAHVREAMGDRVEVRGI
jgi:DNA polymerase-3 subunit alpha